MNGLNCFVSDASTLNSGRNTTTYECHQLAKKSKYPFQYPTKINSHRFCCSTLPLISDGIPIINRHDFNMFLYFAIIANPFHLKLEGYWMNKKPSYTVPGTA